MFNKRRYIIIAAVALIVAGIFITRYFYHSHQRTDIAVSDNNKQNTRENLEKVNKFLVQKDEEKIKSFVKRRGWNMKKTGSGLWYNIYQQKEGKDIKEGQWVKLDYEIRLLDGTLCYTSDSTGAKILQVGRSEEVTGLHEGLQFLGEGDKARLIVPPHLAHGLLGDSERIPARAILVYDLTVRKVSDKKIMR
jgi:FKBP-type peptidyl-prolyl cis-trans isomerase